MENAFSPSLMKCIVGKAFGNKKEGLEAGKAMKAFKLRNLIDFFDISFAVTI